LSLEKGFLVEDIGLYLEMKTIVLKTFESGTDAHMARIRLEEEGIDCFVANEHFSALMPNYFGMMGSGIQLVVFENDASKALEVLSANDTNSELSCPSCGSNSIEYGMGKTGLAKWLVVLMSFLAVIPLSNIRRTNICMECHSEF
jgi:hypothetical protein